MPAPDLTGRTVLITGANSGIGKETARGLARMGATVVMHGRREDALLRARDEVAADTGNEELYTVVADLASLDAVRSMAKRVRSRHDALHILVNNAGFHTSTRTLTEDGYESTFAVCHLAHYLLTHELMDLMRESAPARIVNVASEAHTMGRLRFDDLHGERRWSGLRAYNQAKLANVVFTYALARRIAPATLTVNAMHPGSVRTHWGRKGSGAFGLVVRLVSPFLIGPARGADTVVWLASSPELAGVSGKYFIKRKAVRSNPRSYDPAAQDRLWEVSAEMVGVDPDWP